LRSLRTRPLTLLYAVLSQRRGGNLEDWIAIHKPDVSFMQSIFVQVAQALAFTHNNGVVHADVKLPNVLMDGDGVPHLCDFEFSQAQTFTQSTVAGFGTLEYVAPEVRQLKPGEKLQPSSDMFSFGICLLLALCTPEQYHRTPAGHLGKLQHPDQNLVELIGSLLQVDPDTRPSAIEASRSAFLDPVRLFERANEQIGAAKEEEARVETDAREKSRAIEKQRERAVRDAQAKTRQMRQQEADVRKKLQDEEIAANDRIREAQKSVDRDRRAAAKKQKELAKEQRDLEKKEKDVNVEKSSLEEERGRVATLQKEAL
jgi:serine/threonine protein kinase